jgi:predicted RNA-binding protein associated with RNAse of E/G family
MLPYMIHRPKYRQSALPYGLANNVVTQRWVSTDRLITTEFWYASPKPVELIDDTIIARRGYTWKTSWELGKHFVVTDIYNREGFFVGKYWHISSPVVRVANGAAYDDWYLAVWLAAGAKPVILCQRRLEEAASLGYLSLEDRDTARWVAFRIQEVWT